MDVLGAYVFMPPLIGVKLMLDMPFFTQIDPRAKIKGSRDPLGVQPVWSRMGRQVVRNLTTVTTSLRGFTTLLLGLYVAERVTDDATAEEGEFLAAFLKFEQLAAYSRVAISQQTGGAIGANGEDRENTIRGIRRVERKLIEGKGKVQISANSEDQILSNQKTYGLWGLYSVAARNSGLLEQGSSRLTAKAREFIELNYRSRLQSADHNADVLKLFRSKFVFEPKSKHAKLARNLAEMLGPTVTKLEQEFYNKHLITCLSDHPNEIQERLWKQMRRTSSEDGFSCDELLQIIGRCQAEGDDELARRLDHIRVTESVIAPASRLFSFVLGQDGQALDAIALNVQDTWGARLSHIAPDSFISALSGIGEELGVEKCNRLGHLAKALAAGDYGAAIELLLAQNREVMRERGGDAWVKMKGSRIDVRLRAEAGSLPPGEVLPTLWMYNYFLNSLNQIGFEIERGA